MVTLIYRTVNRKKLATILAIDDYDITRTSD